LFFAAFDNKALALSVISTLKLPQEISELAGNLLLEVLARSRALINFDETRDEFVQEFPLTKTLMIGG